MHDFPDSVRSPRHLADKIAELQRRGVSLRRIAATADVAVDTVITGRDREHRLLVGHYLRIILACQTLLGAPDTPTSESPGDGVDSEHRSTT